MSTYENAPATKLLATACACCGRDLVDAVSVETGIGPECRKRYSVDVVVDEAARKEANCLVASVARKGITRAAAMVAFDRLAALGFTVLADRIAKRFHTVVTAPQDAAELEALRKSYLKIRTEFCYDNCTSHEFNVIVRDMNPSTPAEFVEAAKQVAVHCKRCNGSGHFYRNGSPAGECFRCAGKGHQTLDDARRNRAFDAVHQGYSRAS